MQIVSLILKQTSWQLLGKLFTSISTILIISLISRNPNFKESGVGIFTLALTYLSFFYLAVDLGINAHIIKRFNNQNLELEWRKLLGLRFILASILIIICFFGASFWPKATSEFVQSIAIGALAIYAYAAFLTSNAIFQNKLRYDLASYATLFGAAVTFALIYFLNSFNNLPYLMIGHLVGWVVCALLSIFFVKKFINHILPIFDLKFLKQLIKEIWPFSLTLILNTLYFRVDTFILSFSKTLVDVGIYNLAFQVFQSALVIPTFIMNGFYPILISTLLEDKKKFIKIFWQFLAGLFALSLVGTLLTLLLSPYIIGILVGNGFLGATTSLQILSLSFPAFFVSSLLLWVLVTLKCYKTILLIYSVGLLINLSLNLILIPKYSFIGAALVTGISEYLILILQAIILYRKLKNL